MRPEARDRIRHEYGLDRPIWLDLEGARETGDPLRLFDSQFFHYLRNLAQGNLGESFRLQKPVSGIIGSRLGPTLLLILSGELTGITLGSILGSVAAWKRKTPIDVLAMAVGLKPASEYYNRYPQELSGGQRQRVVVASALVLEPQLLVADEPVSMLDVSIRAAILNLLLRLRDQYGITILYITHDLATAAYLADQVAVMYLGVIVEIGPAKSVLERPCHPYTRSLMSVLPVPNPRRRRRRMVLQGETPNPIDLPPGRRFHPRCPEIKEGCQEMVPVLGEVEPGHYAMCGSPRPLHDR